MSFEGFIQINSDALNTTLNNKCLIMGAINILTSLKPHVQTTIQTF